MSHAVLTPSSPLIQGVASPDVVVDPPAFYRATRRMRFPMRALTSFAGFGSSDSTQLRQTGIVAALEVRVVGSLTFGGTITGTTMSYAWPLGLVKNFKLSANGQSNLINMRGITVRALEYVTNPKIDDTGISATFGSTAITNGSLKMPIDDWGTQSSNALNPGATVPATGAYTFDITYWLPVAADPVSLVGAVYAQSAATNLTLDIDWETQAGLLTLGGSATLSASSVQYSVTGRAYSIPNVNGRYVVPDLSQFHQLAEYRQGGLAQGTNELLLPGTGVGRKLMRIIFQVYSGSTPTPVALNATEYGTVGWAYGGNDQPETYPNGQLLRADGFRVSGVDLGGRWGFGLWDFASQFALRDVIDEGATSDLRILLGLNNSPTSGFAQVLQETLFAAPVGA